MRQIAVFLNDLSFARGAALSARQLLPHVLKMIEVLMRAKKIRRDFAVDGETTLSAAFLGAELHGLAAILQGDDYRDEWRFLKNLEQLSPLGIRDGAISPQTNQEIRYRTTVSQAMSWANQNNSAILSFCIEPEWAEPYARAQLCVLDDTGEIRETEVQIPNLSLPDHVDVHVALIRDYGVDLGGSSLIYRGDGFVIRVYFNDHNPPHIHVMATGDTSETLARISIATTDILDSPRALPPSMRRKVVEWAAERKEDLMNCWNECRALRHPPMIEDSPI